MVSFEVGKKIHGLHEASPNFQAPQKAKQLQEVPIIHPNRPTKSNKPNQPTAISRNLSSTANGSHSRFAKALGSREETLSGGGLRGLRQTQRF